MRLFGDILSLLCGVYLSFVLWADAGHVLRTWRHRRPAACGLVVWAVMAACAAAAIGAGLTGIGEALWTR